MIPGALFLLLASFVISTVSLDYQTYIVHIDKAKTGSDRWHESVIDSIAELSSSDHKDTTRPELLYVYETAFSGFAARLSAKHLDSLNKVDGFLSVTNDELLSLHTTHSPQFLGLREGEGLWGVSNLASDVIIGVLDTGIWPEHVSFHDSGFPPIPSRWKGACEEGIGFLASNCNKKLIGARAYFKGYEAIAGRVNGTADFRSARDKQGHGTHTASTAGGTTVKKANLLGFAKGSAAGMRHSSRIAAYKVCWQFGCASSDILAAMNQAIADGVDVMSLSLGGIPKPYYADNIAIAAFGAMENGIFVSCSAGNSGPSPSTVSNTAPWIMTVAASYMDRRFSTKVKLGNGQTFEGSSLYSGPGTKQLPLVYNNTAGSNGAEFCLARSLDPNLVKGKIVVCDRGINSRAGKGEQVKLAGGLGMLLLNTDDEGEELFADAHILPATSLGATAANSIRNYANSGMAPRASMSFRGTVYGNVAPIVAAFSSRGPSLFGPDVIKPDVTAPGVNILAAWPPIVGPSLLKSDNRSVLFNIISGTSMSCPHVSGLAALLKSVHANWSTTAIKSALMTTSYILDNKRAPMGDMASGSGSGLATPFGIGSGHVDPERAADPGLVYDISSEDYLNYLCSLGYTSSQVALFAKRSYTCSRNAVSLQPGDLNYPSFAVLFNKTTHELSFTYKRTVTNVGAALSSYQVQVVEPDGVTVTVKPTSLKFGKFGEKLSYQVTFSALDGTLIPSTNSSFGSIVWVSGRYTVRSPIAVTWV